MASRKAVVDAVKSWDGVKYGSKAHHDIIDIYNKRVGGMNYYAAWCAATASAAAIKAGVADLYPLGISCGEIIKQAKRMGIWVEDDRFVPSVADWLIYDWDDGTDYASYDNREGHDHIGTVIAVSGNAFVVEEGNMGRPSHVGRRTVKVNGRYIRGFVHPKFPEDWKRWLKAAGVRAVRTVCQTAIATIGTATVMGGVSWPTVVSAAVLAGVLSLLTSLAGLPEVEPDEIEGGE